MVKISNRKANSYSFEGKGINDKIHTTVVNDQTNSENEIDPVNTVAVSLKCLRFENVQNPAKVDTIGTKK